jgi:hypothetical protein
VPRQDQVSLPEIAGRQDGAVIERVSARPARSERQGQRDEADRFAANFLPNSYENSTPEAGPARDVLESAEKLGTYRSDRPAYNLST